uniref:Dehydrogenase/reductase (SDR family) member 13b.1 n=1 Tax=Xiphophorus couchianus TaxID=32473 RepID=A0A3B5L918_9TELE
MSVVLLVVGVVIGVAYIYRHIVVKGKRCTSKAKLHGKTVIVTGNSTFFFSTALLSLVLSLSYWFLSCEGTVEGCAVSLDGSSQVVFMQLDLGSLKSIRSFAESFLKSEPRLDILINNAGICLQGQTEDGFGLMFGVNHLGHFLLTNLLLDRLKECAPSRIINVSSMAHNFGKIDFDCLNSHKALGLGTSFIRLLQIYCDSKLCNALFNHELAKRLRGTQVTCYTLHPGAISSELGRNTGLFLQIVLKPITTFFFKNTVQGCQTTLHCALQEGIEPLSGRYFSNCTVRDLFAKARDDAAAKKLWEISERLCGLV